jgi:prepilin-type processing-associated H-X9-DG protein
MRAPLLLVAVLMGCSSGESNGEEANDTDTGTAGVDDTSSTVVDTATTVDTDPGDVAAETAVDTTPDTKSAGCMSGKELAEGAATITVGSGSRKYTLRKPTGYTRDKAWPLVLALHPNGSNMAYWDGTTGARAMRPILKDKAILVLPEARMGDWRGDLPTDLAYFEALITLLKKEMCIDTSRIFSMGFSGGGSFSGVLGCSRTDIRAIASGGAVIYFDKAKCVGKPAAWITIGDGESIPGRIEFRDYWRTRNGCSTMTTVVPPASTCVAYGCPDPKLPVQFCSHAGDHVWPDFGANAAWSFFSKF